MNFGSDTMGKLVGGTEVWPAYYSPPLCRSDQSWFFSTNIYAPICIPQNAQVIGRERWYEDEHIRSIGGLGTWTADTSPVVVSGGGDPRSHGHYSYVGHYWGLPLYQKGNMFIYGGAGSFGLAERGSLSFFYNSNAGYAYPYQASGWQSGFGNVYNAPTFTKGTGGGTAQIPRWPVMVRPPGVAPYENGWYQRDYVYEPGFIEEGAPLLYAPPTEPGINAPPPTLYVSPSVPVYEQHTSPSYSEQAAPVQTGMTIFLEEDPYQSPPYVPPIYGGIDPTELGPPQEGGYGGPVYLGPPVESPGAGEYESVPINQPPPLVTGVDGTIVHANTSNPTPAEILATIEGALSDAVGGDGTIFGYSPLMVIGVGAVALFFLTKK